MSSLRKDTDCKFSDLIEYSFGIGVDIDNRSFPDKVWDND